MTAWRVRAGAGIAAIVALALGVAAMLGARAWLADLLTAAGAPEPQRPLAGPASPRPEPAENEGAQPPRRIPPVRVVLLDGLTRADARGPALDAFCARGLDLAVDVGFPTKSLPVQSVLWSGLTMQQSGLPMRNELARPLTETLPAQIAGSRAVVEAWPQIARGVGFARVDEPAAAAATAAETETARWAAFAGAAREAVASDAPLVLVHVLSIDEAGHRGGRDATYRATIARADALLGELLAHDATWLVISDHGHLARGGHGDAEDEVRIVRGCVVPRPLQAPATAAVHLVDVSRHLHDVLDVAPAPRAVGRPLAVAAAHPDAGATLPRVSTFAYGAALTVVLLGLAIALRWGRPRAAALAPALAIAAYTVACGTPSLSHREPNLAILVGIVAAAAVLAPRGRAHPARVMALVAPALSTGIAAALLCRIPGAAVGGAPARVPFATAWAQVLVGTVTPALLFGFVLAAWLLSERRTKIPSGNRTETSGGSDQAVRDSDSP
jgi:hypothetical protein